MQRPSLSIAFVTVADLPEGCGRTGRLRTLVGALVGMGHKVRVWNQHSLESSGAEQVSGSFAGAPFEYVLGTTTRQRGFLSASLKIRAVKRILGLTRTAARAGQLDLVIFNNLAFYDTFPVTRLARRLGIPTIQCYEDERREIIGGNDLPLSQRIFGWNSWVADRWCSPMADQIWVISSYLHEKYARLSGHVERVHIIPTIIDCASWMLGPEPIGSTPVLLYSGAFGDQDDMDKLARVLGCLKSGNVCFRMLLLGARPELPQVRRFRSLVRNLGIESFIEFKGFCSAAEVKREIAGANILINLRTNSIWSKSGLSTKLSEYLAAGRTVLTTEIGDNARYVDNGKSALVVSPDDPPEKIAELLKRAIENPEWRIRLGEAGRAVALRHFDQPVIQRMLAHAIAQLPVPTCAAQQTPY